MLDLLDEREMGVDEMQEGLTDSIPYLISLKVWFI